MGQERLSKKAAASETAGLADAGNAVPAFPQHNTSLLQPVCPQILSRRSMQTVLEGPKIFPLADEPGGGDVSNFDVVLIILMDIDHHQLDFSVRYFLLRTAMLS